MRGYISIAVLFVSFETSVSFMAFSELGDLMNCYGSPRGNQLSNEMINGQAFPLPSSMETFISLVERLESFNPTTQPTEIIRKLLVSFRVSEVPANLLFQDDSWDKINVIERALFNIETIKYDWKEKDVSDDEKCALHLMLSHSINHTLQGIENGESIDGISKHFKEYGVVSLHGKKRHAIALGKVLLGIYAGLMGTNEIDAKELSRRTKNAPSDDRFNDIKINRLVAVTLADIVTAYISDKNFKRESVSFMPNGEWKDTSCTTDYFLDDNNKQIISNSLIRGAIDGLIIGKRIEANPAGYRNTRLSAILRMYYGPSGLVEASESSSKADVRSDFQWCKRLDHFRAIQNINEDILSYLRFYKNLAKNVGNDELLRDISDVLQFSLASSQIFSDISDESTTECSRIDTALEKCKTPADIFPILDWQTNDHLKNLQIQLLGLLSLDFEIRPHGNSIGAYTNLSPLQNRGLHVIANNTGIAGAASCYARHYKRVASSKQGEVEVLMNLNQTLTDFIATQDSSDFETLKAATPAKVVLYFNSGNPTDDYRLRDAVWEIEKNFREVTILAIGSKKESLQVFTRNADTDLFTESGISLAWKLKTRICKAPSEFRFKECYKNNRGSEADNKQSGFVPVNKKQYWAMYPKYFLKSFSIKLKFKALDGGQIKVCFSRSYYRIVEESSDYKECRDTSGDAEFTLSNPCYRRNAQNCDPFYFSIEGVKSGVCESFYCRTPKDIIFEFSHEGISCNSSNLIFSSSLLILSSILMILLKRV